jgi:hypothetical protein
LKIHFNITLPSPPGSPKWSPSLRFPHHTILENPESFSLTVILHFLRPAAPSGPGPPPCWSSTITLTHTTPGRTPLDDWSVRRRNLYLTTHKHSQ